MDKNKKLFPQRLWELINDEKFNFCLRWSDDGQRVYLNRNEFELHYLQTPNNQFHTQKAISFVRQMNMYGFRKVDDCHYENDNFKRDCPQLIINMVRRHTSRAFANASAHANPNHTARYQQSSSSLFGELHRRHQTRQPRHLLRGQQHSSEPSAPPMPTPSRPSVLELEAARLTRASLELEAARLTCAQHQKQPVSTLYQRLASSYINQLCEDAQPARQHQDQHPHQNQHYHPSQNQHQQHQHQRYSLILEEDIFNRNFSLLGNSTPFTPSNQSSPQSESDNIVLNLAKRPG